MTPQTLLNELGPGLLGFIQTHACVVKRICSSYGDRFFAAAGPRLWNSLPAHLRQTDINFEQFKRQLKTFLLGRWERGALWLLLNCAFQIILLTYLLTYLHNFYVYKIFWCFVHFNAYFACSVFPGSAKQTFGEVLIRRAIWYSVVSRMFALRNIKIW